jgi:acyl carrier protein
MPADIENRIVELISAACEVPKEEITPESRLEELGLDSLVLTELGLKLRKEFGVTAADEDLDQVETVGELFRLVAKSRAA